MPLRVKADKPSAATLFMPRVERAAARAIGLRAKAEEQFRLDRQGVPQVGYAPISTGLRASKVMEKALPGSTPRLREQVISIVKKRKHRRSHFPNRKHRGY